MTFKLSNLTGRWREHEVFWQLLALAVSFVLVHTAYELAVRPVAYEELQRQAAAEEQAEIASPTLGARIAVVVKDYEQEACFCRPCSGRSPSCG